MKRYNLLAHFSMALSAALLPLVGPTDQAVAAMGPEDAAERAAQRAAEDAARAAQRAEEAAARASRDHSRIDQRAAQDRAQVEERAARDTARVSADSADAAARAEEEAATTTADAAERAAKDAADAAEDAAKAAEDAAKAAQDAAEDAAKEAEDALDDRSSSNSGSSGSGGISGSGQPDNGAAALRELASSESPEVDERGYPVRRGELIALDLSDGVTRQAQAQGFRVIGSERLAALDAQVTRLSVPAGMSAVEGMQTLRRLAPGVEVDLSHYYGAEAGLAGGSSGTAVAAHRVGTARTTRGPAIRVGMIDGRVSAHPLLARTRITARDFGDGAGAASAHGTAVASIMAGDGAREILAANVFRGQGAQQFTSPDAIVRALGWLMDNRVAVVNISLAGPRNLVLDRVIDRAATRGHIIVAAAGNGGPSAAPAYPAALPNVVAVTAVDGRNHVYRYANHGDYISMAARGVDVMAAMPNGMQAPHSGTSFAAPHVASRIALCARRVSVNNRACVDRLMQSAIDLGAPGRDPVYGAGLLNAQINSVDS